MKLSSFTNIISSTFTDIMDVYRYQPVVNEDGTTNVELSDLPIMSELPCRLSFIKLENASDTSIDSTPVEYMPKLFYRVTDELVTADYIIVSRVNDEGVPIKIYEGNIGLPAVYVTHKEALFAVKGEA